jgi:hypothetical protein
MSSALANMLVGSMRVRKRGYAHPNAESKTAIEVQEVDGGSAVEGETARGRAGKLQTYL